MNKKKYSSPDIRQSNVATVGIIAQSALSVKDTSSNIHSPQLSKGNAFSFDD